MLPRVLLLLLVLAAPAWAVPTISSKEIKPGMQGTLYTVLQGTEIVPIHVELLGVAENSLGRG